MLSLFRLNDPLRIAFVAIIVLLIRLPFMLDPDSLMLPELGWLLLGERIAQGKELYESIWEQSAPLAAFCYGGIVAVFGKSKLALAIMAWLLMVFQAGYYNRVLIRRDVYKEKSYLPTLFYGLFMTASLDLATLSPALLSTTFLLPMLATIFSLGKKGKDEEVFLLGLYLGLATTVHFANITFVLVVLWGIATFKVLSPKLLGLALLGFLSVWGGVSIYFYFTGSLGNFLNEYLLSSLRGLHGSGYITQESLLWVLGVPIIIAGWGMLLVFSERGFVNFQINVQRIMIVWLLASGLSLIFVSHFATYQLAVAMPALAFFGTHWVLLFKRVWLVEIIAFLLFVAMGLLAYNQPHFLLGQNPDLYAKLRLQPTAQSWQNKKLLVLADSMSYYHNNSLSTPYMNWTLASERHFNHLDNYRILSEIHQNILADPPEIIVDPNGIGKNMLLQIPALQRVYQADAQHPNVYYLNPNALDKE